MGVGVGSPAGAPGRLPPRPPPLGPATAGAGFPTTGHPGVGGVSPAPAVVGHLGGELHRGWEERGAPRRPARGVGQANVGASREPNPRAVEVGERGGAEGRRGEPNSPAASRGWRPTGHTQGGLGANTPFEWRHQSRQSGQRVPRNASLPLQPSTFLAFRGAPQGTPSPHLLCPSLHPGPGLSSRPGAPPAPSQSTVSFPPAPAPPVRGGLAVRSGMVSLQSPSGQPVRRPQLPRPPTPAGPGRGRSSGGKEPLWASRCFP